MLTFKISKEIREEVEHKLEIALDEAAELTADGNLIDAVSWVVVAEALREALVTTNVLTLTSPQQAAEVATELYNAADIARDYGKNENDASAKRFAQRVFTLIRDIAIAFNLTKNREDEFSPGALNELQLHRQRGALRGQRRR